jgi:type IV pilus assembly protein PilA
MLQFIAKRLRELHEVERDERGFTLIELLVVILIIAILAAIAIPVFLAQRERAWEATAQSDARNAAAAATSCYTADPPPQSYTPGCDEAIAAELNAFGYNKTQAINILDFEATACHWGILVQHASGGDPAMFTTFNTAAVGDSNAGQVRMAPGVATVPAAPACP